MISSPTIHDPGKLRRRRIRAGLNQIDLARQTGLHQTYISYLERGRKNPTAKTLKIITDALGCDVDDVLRKQNSRRPKSAVASVPRASSGRAA